MTDENATNTASARTGPASAVLAAAAALTVALVSPAQGQVSPDQPFSVNVRGGVNVPTFDIADVADPGPSFGVGLKYAVSDRIFLRANGDFGFHPGAELGSGAGAVELPDVDVFHYIGGAGYRLTPAESPFYASVNLGAGAMTLDVDVQDPAPGAETSFTYFAINAGGELGYRLSRNISLFFSPQGDIAFVDDEDLDPNDVVFPDDTIDTAWVWPFTAGVEVTF
jgi:hypothetical protein